MFIDFLTLLLVNMAAGLVLLAAYVLWGIGDPEQPRWAPAFFIVGLVAFLFGGFMTLTWPLPGPFNIIFGEMSVFYGVIFLGAAWALARGIDLFWIAAYAFFAGAAALLNGIRVIGLHLTSEPILSGAGFILSGLAGIFAAPTIAWSRNSTFLRVIAALVLLAAAAIWAFTGYSAYWTHLESFGKWLPPLMRGMGQ